MSQSFLKSIVWAIAALALNVSCTAPSTHHAADHDQKNGSDDYKSYLPGIDRTSQGTGQVLLAYQFINPGKVVPSDGCRLRIENTKSGRSVFLTMKPNDPGSLTSLEPGNYITRRLGCGLTSVWTVEDLFAKGFDIEAGRVSYLGKLAFTFNSGGDLETIKKSSRIESAEALTFLLQGLAQGVDDRLISGFTDKTIDKKMLQGAHRDGFDVFALGLQPDHQAGLSPLLDHLKKCSQEDGRRDPLRYGALEYVAIYRSGQFESIRDRNDDNALSDDLRSCIDQSLQKFTLNGAKGEIRVRVRY